MIDPKDFYSLLEQNDIGFFTGVPDSLLKSFCAFVTKSVPSERHIIAANEGGATGIALGYHLATNNIPLVYMQNSGLGNIVNPLLSLADKEVYATPILLLVGWRGQPGFKDEPQHVKQGRVMPAMLDAMEIPHINIGTNLESAKAALKTALKYMRTHSAPFALTVEKGAFADYEFKAPVEDYELTREAAIQEVINALPNTAAVVGTTGMTSRELFEYRAVQSAGHNRDFLTVGGMGHASQIALGIALQQPNRPVICLDGDGAALMHMGGMAIIADQATENYVHIVINNGAHGSVGGQPTVGRDIGLPAIAVACGYKYAASCDTAVSITKQLTHIMAMAGTAFLEINVQQGHRSDLGRPTSSPVQNKTDFKDFLAKS